MLGEDDAGDVEVHGVAVERHLASRSGELGGVHGGVGVGPRGKRAGFNAIAP